VVVPGVIPLLPGAVVPGVIPLLPGAVVPGVQDHRSDPVDQVPDHPAHPQEADPAPQKVVDEGVSMNLMIASPGFLREFF